MTSRRRLAVLVLVLAAGFIGRAGAAPAGCALEARTGLAAGNGSLLEGDLVVTDAGGRASIGRGTRAADATSVAADLVVLGNDASVFDVDRGTLRKASDAAIRGLESPTSFPLASTCSVPAVPCGGEDVLVPKLGSLLLSPGTYGLLRLEDGAAVAMVPGAYAFCGIRTGRSAALSAGPDAATTIDVAGDVVMGDGTLFGSPDGTVPPELRVAGARVRLPGRIRIKALVRSPAARLTIGRAAELAGGACARTIKLDRRVAFRCDETGPTSTTTSTTPAPTSTSTSTTTVTTPPSTTSTASPTTSTVAASTTTTSSTTTSSSSTTTVSAPPPTSTTSITVGPTTTSTSSTTATPTTTSTTTTTSPPGCGDGIKSAAETCDDGNNSDNDGCPADCRIDACTPDTASQRFVSVQFEPPLGALVAGLSVLVDYPEGAVDLPGNGTTFPSGTISGVPTGSQISVNDLNFNGKGHAVRVTIAGQSGHALTPGQIVRLKFQDCQGATVPTADQFLCTVLSASDPFLNRVDGVRCFVVLQ